uniref:Uncharacterized protein n=1 Tax=Kalanchoe fedtschenkoi TaxID=63787 RepID=A0A7N0VGH4_KALFE
MYLYKVEIRSSVCCRILRNLETRWCNCSLSKRRAVRSGWTSSTLSPALSQSPHPRFMKSESLFLFDKKVKTF